MAVMVRGDAASDSRVAGSADHRGIPLDLGASLPGARQRSCLRTRLHVSGEGDGYPRSTDLSWVAVAEWLCRTSDRHIAPRVSGSSGHLRRDAPPANSFRLCGTLQSSAHALGITEGCALASSGPTIWRHCRHSDPGWTAPSIRPDMIFGKDRLQITGDPLKIFHVLLSAIAHQASRRSDEELPPGATVH